MKKLIYATAIIMLSGLVIQSCQKKEVDNDTQSTTDYAYLRMGFNTTVPLANNITVNEEGVKSMEAYSCANVTLTSGDTTNWPANGDTLVYTVDYGTTGCIDSDGRLKQGMVTVAFISDFSLAGGKIIMDMSAFYVDNIKYAGHIELTNTGNNTYTSVLTNGICTNSSWQISYSGTTTFTWLSGSSTPADPSDDTYEYTENGTAINRAGRTFTIVTDNPLHKDADCKWISSGTVSITPDGLATRTVDFGSGTCDNQAKMTINGRVFDFNMQ